MSEVGENPQEHYRLFIAVAVPDSVKEKIKAAQDELCQALPHGAIRWTKMDQFHLTLRFLRSVSTVSSQALIDSLRTACRSFGVLTLAARGIGFFPNAKAPRVVWVGVQDSANRLAQLHQTVQEATLRFTSEKSEEHFRGHITLGRAKDLGRRETDVLRRTVERFSATLLGEWPATDIYIMRSKLSPHGAEHTVFAAVPLA